VLRCARETRCPAASQDAASDLRSSKAFFASRSVVVGERILEHIANVIARLQTFPRLGHPGIVGGTLERTVPRSPYVIV
jgi:plasmid stabilization system protein ParE